MEVTDNTEKRLRKCFGEAAKAYNGRLTSSLLGSVCFYETFAHRWADEFIHELYEEWRETHDDKGVNDGK